MRGSTGRVDVLPRTTGPACTVVTLPTDAAFDADGLLDLLRAGLDVAVIDTRFDTPAHWRAMAEQVKRASAGSRRPVSVWLQLHGHWAHTLDFGEGPNWLKLKPAKNEFGQVYAPARLGLYALGAGGGVMQRVDASVAVWSDWLRRLKRGDEINFIDARCVKRHLIIEDIGPWGAVAQCPRTAYLNTQTVLRIGQSSKKKKHSTLICKLEQRSPGLSLRVGDVLRLARHPASSDAEIDPPLSVDSEGAVMGCSDAQWLRSLTPGSVLWFGATPIQAQVQHVDSGGVTVLITHALPRGSRLLGGTAILSTQGRLSPNTPTSQELGWLRALNDVVDAVVSGPIQSAQDLKAWMGTAQATPSCALVARLASPSGAKALVDGELGDATNLGAR
ncbi:MAG: hypothetical protein OHK0048_02000 [Rhodoferax sp.]